MGKMSVTEWQMHLWEKRTTKIVTEFPMSSKGYASKKILIQKKKIIICLVGKKKNFKSN